MSSLRIFFEWSIKEGLLSQNPTEGLRKRKTSPRIVNIPKEVLTRLLELPDKRTFAGVRDYALFLLHLDTGIRPGEASNLLLSDFDMRAGTIEVRSTVSKTRTRRTLFLNRPTIKALTDYISVRPPEWENLPIFCTWEGRPFTPYAWGQRIRDAYEERLGVRITPYMLRHAFALGFLRNEGNIFALQRIMGHSSLEMTRRYLALTDQDLKEASVKASPLNNLLKANPKKRLRKIHVK
jgi:site-specific recombinase XerD